MNKSEMNAGPVGVFEGYVDGEPLVKWLDRRNMPQVGDKLCIARAAAAPTIISIELIDGLADQYLRDASSDYAKRAFARAIEQMALANAGALGKSQYEPGALPDLRALEAAYEASRAALAAQEALGKAKVAEVVSVLLWLYRRLPRGYGRMPFVDLVIEKLARGAGIDVVELLSERGENGAPAAPVDLASGRPVIFNVGAAISAASVEAEMHGVAGANEPANEPGPGLGGQLDGELCVERVVEIAESNEFTDHETGKRDFDRLGFARGIERELRGKPKQDPARAVRSMRERIETAAGAGQLERGGADKLHRKIRRAERLVTEVQCALWPHRSSK